MRVNSFITISVAAILALASTSHAQPAAAPAPTSERENTTEARALYRQAEAAYGSGKTQEARELFLKAWAIQPTADVALGLGQAEVELALYRDAAEHLEFATRNFPLFAGDKALDAAKMLYAEAAAHVGQVQVVVSEAGAEVRVDGRTVGKSPLSVPVFVTAGSHEIEARVGAQVATQVIEAEMGKKYSVSLALNSEALVSPSGNGTAPAAPSAQRNTEPLPPGSIAEDPDRRSIVPLIVGGAVFVAGASAAIGLHLAANSKHDELQSYRSKNGVYGCITGTASASDCAAQWDAGKAVERNRNWSTAGIVVGATALVATSVYWFWPRQDATTARHERKRFQFAGSIQANRPGILISGEF